MKRLLFLLSLVALAGAANATNYYVSATGNDASNGTSPATAWKTISKVNSFTFAANDSILFKRGDVFFGSIIVNRNNLNYAAYGTGARPLISGFATLSGWTLVSAGIYQASVTAKSTLNMVTVNGRPQQIGRYPNASDANGGYLVYEGATATSITDNELTTAVNWTGAEVAIRKNGWMIDKGHVTNHTGGTITYRMARNINTGNSPQMSNAKVGHGYFFMDDPRTLDQFGEWYFDTTAKKLQMFFGSNTPSNYDVRVSVVDTLMNMGNRTYISVNELNFEGGNQSGVYSYLGGFVTVKNCNFTNIGSRAVHFFSSNDVLVENVNTNNVLSNAIQVINRTKNNVTVRNCVARNTSPFAGMGSFYDDSDNKGMYITVASNGLIEYNVVDSVGLSGIQFAGNNIVVQNNFVNYFCYRLHDNGGIYTYAGGTDANPSAFFTNRLVKNNIIMNGIGAPHGTNSSAPYVAGIYLDGRTMNVTVLNNTVFNSAKNGIHCNNPSNITIRGNTFFNNLQDISFMRWGWGSINNLVIKRNISFPYNETQRNIYYTNAGLNTPTPTTLEDNLRSLGSIDSNYYNTFTDAGFQFEIYNTEGGSLMQTSPYSLDGWRSLTSYDHKAKRPAQKIQPYTLNGTIGANRFTNSQFNSNITGVTLFGTSTTAAFDNTGKITGAGSLRMNFAAPQANKYSFIHGAIGAVNSGKKYILRFKTLGTTVNGIVRAYFRKSTSPYNNLVPTQLKSFGTSITTHEFLIDGPTTEAGASFVIEIEQNSGTTYIDDIEVYEADATLNTVQSQLRFEYNATNQVKEILLDAKYVGVDSMVYNGVISLQPYTSQVLIKSGPIDTLPVAEAGADKYVYLPADSVILTGTGTGVNITSYAWTKISGPAQFLISTPGNATTKVRNLVLGTYRFELRVTDSRGFVSRDTLSVIVSSTLPVRLLRFSAVKNTGKVNLKWVTTSEVNSMDYVVEKRINGRDFVSIGRVASNNISDRQSTYNFTDNNPGNGINYYRLKMIDHDGTFTYSNILSVEFKTYSQVFELEQAVLSAGSLKLNVSSSKKQVLNILAADAAGRVVMKKQVQLQAGMYTLVNDIPAANTGIYYIKIFTDEHAIIKTMLHD